MPSIMPALAVLRPGINCQPKPGFSSATTIDEVQWDAPLPENFEPPTQQEVDAEIARQAAAAERITVERLYFMLEIEDQPGLADAIEALLDGLAEAGNRKPRIYWRDAKVFESDHPLVLQLGAHPSVGLTVEGIRDLFAAAYAKQLVGAA